MVFNTHSHVQVRCAEYVYRYVLYDQYDTHERIDLASKCMFISPMFVSRLLIVAPPILLSVSHNVRCSINSGCGENEAYKKFVHGDA